MHHMLFNIIDTGITYHNIIHCNIAQNIQLIHITIRLKVLYLNPLSWIYKWGFYWRIGDIVKWHLCKVFTDRFYYLTFSPKLKIKFSCMGMIQFNVSNRIYLIFKYSENYWWHGWWQSIMIPLIIFLTWTIKDKDHLLSPLCSIARWWIQFAILKLKWGGAIAYTL